MMIINVLLNQNVRIFKCFLKDHVTLKTGINDFILIYSTRFMICNHNIFFFCQINFIYVVQIT